MNIPAGIDPADIMQSDVMDCLPEYKCPFCGAYMFYLRDDDAECQECGQVFGVELVIKNASTWSFRFWQKGAIITRPTQRAADECPTCKGFCHVSDCNSTAVMVCPACKGTGIRR